MWTASRARSWSSPSPRRAWRSACRPTRRRRSVSTTRNCGNVCGLNARISLRTELPGREPPLAIQPDLAFLDSLYAGLDAGARLAVERTVEAMVAAREQGGKVVVVTGSGPNIHEGVTT